MWAFSFSAKAEDARKAFCHRQWSDFQELLSQPQNQIGFNNLGGDLGLGLCLWHSRFTRSANYLAVFLPELAVPTSQEARKLMEKIAKNNEVVEVPGFSNLKDFTWAFRYELLDLLNHWQKFDGFVRMTWVNTLAGAQSASPQELENRMNDLYDLVTRQKKIVYQKLKYSDSDIHAWLVTKVVPFKSGYTLSVVDSNAATRVLKVLYTRGAESLQLSSASQVLSFVPYTEKDEHFSKFYKNIRKYCAQETSLSEPEKWKEPSYK
jgi:hypothetical protein